MRNVVLLTIGILLAGCATQRGGEVVETPPTQSPAANADLAKAVEAIDARTKQFDSDVTTLKAATAEMGAKLDKALKRHPDQETVEPQPKQLNKQIVRYLGTDTRGWTRDQTGRTYTGLYTRIRLSAADDKNGAGGEDKGQGGNVRTMRDYEAENRGWLARLWQAENDTAVTTAEVYVSDPDFKLSIPLYSVTHNSNRDQGNVWKTNFTADYVEAPIMKLGPNTAIVVHLHAKISSDLKSQAAATVLSAVTAAVKIAAPQSALLTPLSKPEVNNAANAFDTAISALNSKDLEEDIELGRLTDSWQPGANFKFSACAPFVRTENDENATPDKNGNYPALTDNRGCGLEVDIDSNYNTPVAGWSFELACPRLSVFDSRDICHQIGSIKTMNKGGHNLVPFDSISDKARVAAEIEKSVTYDTIANFRMSSQVTLPDFIRAQSWYTSFIAAPRAGASAEPAGEFCAEAIEGLAENGFNDFDAGLILRYLARTDSRIRGKSITNAAECKTLFAERTHLAQSVF